MEVKNITFSEKLKKVMEELGISQRQLVGMTGIGKSSISQYLSGSHVPTAERRRSIAIELGLEPEYFENEIPVIKLAKKNSYVIPELLPKDAGKLMRMGQVTIQEGLKQGVFPWGYAIETSPGHFRYFINAIRFAELECIEVPSELVK